MLARLEVFGVSNSVIEMLEKGLKSSCLLHVNLESVDISGVPCDLISQFVSSSHAYCRGRD